MSTETTVSNLKINKLTSAQYATITPSATELYLTDEVISSSDVTTALGYTPENQANKTTTLSASSTDTQYPSAKCVYDAIQAGGGGSITVDQTYNATSANAQSGVAIAGAGFVQNTATGSNALTIGGTATTNGGATNIGKSAVASKSYSTAVGYNSQAKGNYSSAVGWNAMATKTNAIQIGYGTNTTQNSLAIGFYNVGTYQLLDGTTGKIPSGRLNIATTLSSSNTDAEVVSAKCVYDILHNAGLI